MSVIVVAAESRSSSVPTAHAVPDIGGTTHLSGMSLCGFPAEHLTILVGMEWEDVDPLRRCSFCQQELSSR